MIIKKTEYHRVNSILTYEVDEEEIVEQFGSVEEFVENHYATESDEFWDFMMGFDYDREDDWWSDRKGGYEVEWEIES
jgi:hypothetical protein